MKNIGKFIGTSLALAFALAVFFAGFVWAGYVVAILWGWFAVPLFGVVAINTWQAVGLLTITKMFVPSKTVLPKSIQEDKWHDLKLMVTKPAVALLVGYVVKTVCM